MLAIGFTFRLDGPLAVDWDMKIPELQREIRLAAPKRSGRLASALVASQFSKEPPVARVQAPGVPYAYIQQFGGVVPERTAKGTAPMRWFGDYGWVTKWVVGPSVIPAKHYIEQGIDRWYQLVSVDWAKGAAIG